ncbi:MAG TPA: acylphosphatase [Bacteroidia bacterium]|nr:acylphosphatase [Bacteroidia bacterium]
MAATSVRIVVKGLVQGVFFRKHTVTKALQLQLSGFVMNIPDGSVLIEAQGSPQSLDLFIAWCRTGPPAAQVTGVEVIEIPDGEYRTFTIRR